jgi:hypothetical protein
MGDWWWVLIPLYPLFIATMLALLFLGVVVFLFMFVVIPDVYRISGGAEAWLRCAVEGVERFFSRTATKIRAYFERKRGE